MSEIKVNSIKGVGASSAAITVNNTDGSCTAQVTNNLSNRRMNINGGMSVWQRATSVAVSDGSNEEVQACDRYGFKFGNAAAGAATVSRSTDVPTNLGFPYSFKIDVTTINDNSAANTQVNFFHRFEAQDIVNSGWKYNDSNSFLTISFYFKSNKSGTNKLPVRLETQDGTKYWYVSEITQSDTNWNRHTVKIPGNSNLTFNADNGYGLDVGWFLTAGSTYHGTADTWGTTQIHGTSNSTNYMDSTSNELFFTGIQIEATTNGIATDFEHRSFAVEKRLCMRYYQQYTNIMMVGYAPDNSNRSYAHAFTFPVEFRSAPTLTISNTGSVAGQYVTDGEFTKNVTSLLSAACQTTFAEISLNLSGDLVNYRGAYTIDNTSTSRQTTYYITAEL